MGKREENITELEISSLITLLISIVKGTAVVNQVLREREIPHTQDASRYIVETLFLIITDECNKSTIEEAIAKGIEIKNRLCGEAKKREVLLPDMDIINLAPQPGEYIEAAKNICRLAEKDANIKSLKELVFSGITGAALHTQHALNLKFEESAIYTMIENCLSEISRNDITIEQLTSLLFTVGECGIKAMMLLDKAHNYTFGERNKDKAILMRGRIIEGINNKKIDKIVLFAGCDCKEKTKNIFTKYAESIPDNCVMIAFGCTKLWFNDMEFGVINGLELPRLLTVEKCNDSISHISFILSIKEALKVAKINDLPFVYNVAGHEQIGIIALLTLISIGIKNINLGPGFPPFLSKNIIKMLIERFNLKALA